MQDSISVLSMNCVRRTLRAKGRTADFAVLSNSSRWVAMIELKGGQNLKIGQIVEQIQNGLDMLVNGLGDQIVDEFFPILVHHSDRDPRRTLSGRMITLRGTQRRIIVAECGDRLAPLIRA